MTAGRPAACLICSLEAEKATCIQSVVAGRVLFDKKVAHLCAAHREEVERAIHDFEVAIYARRIAEIVGSER